MIGNRAFGTDPDTVARFGRAFAAGLLAGGVLPVVKHIPGHGRAAVDSHHDLPVVTTDRETLERVDFAPFAMLADLPMAMTAHVVYTALDPDAPATTSRRVVEEIMRGVIGFDGLLLSDDLSMNALAGSLGTARGCGPGCGLRHPSALQWRVRRGARGRGRSKACSGSRRAQDRCRDGAAPRAGAVSTVMRPLAQVMALRGSPAA